MALLGMLLVAQLAVAARPVTPVLEFPTPGLDDTAAYQGYRTRFFRDAAGNTIQIYIDGRSGRVVHLLADAADESIALSVRGADGAGVGVTWDDATPAHAWRSGRTRTFEHSLVANASDIRLGLFLLGSMRVERDFQYAGLHQGEIGAATFVPKEFDRLLAALGKLEPAERRRALASLGANSVASLATRLRPTVDLRRTDSLWIAHVLQPALDARDTLVLDIRVDARRVDASRGGNSIALHARSGTRVPFALRFSTTAGALTPLTRQQIFTPEFLRFLNAAHAESTSVRSRWLERNVRGVELLASREKLMAGLPAYATYFGRDMLVSALMMRPIWRDEMSELAIASVLRKLSPSGQVSHEEALGGQAVRESAARFADLVDRAAVDRAAVDSALAVLRDHARTRENYHMIDNLFQLPVLAGRWLGDANVSTARKRAFLVDSSDGGGTRLSRLLSELALVASLTQPYAAQPTTANLVSFAPRDSGRWMSASWRDSDVGYGGGRYAMDVNAIWVPHALESIERIVTTLDALGISRDSIVRATPALRGDGALARYLRDPAQLRQAIHTWKGAWTHFVVRLGPDDLAARVRSRLAALPVDERATWEHVLTETHADRDSLVFLAIALDGAGAPIGVANTDPGTGLFLGGDERALDRDADGDDGVLRDARLFGRAYPVGLFIDGVGPVVANDAYATPAVWAAFERDRYHGPRVVWGREVNLFALGVMTHIAQAGGDPARAALVGELRATLARVLDAAHASGFHSELWSYEVRNGRAVPVRYGTGSDVQLWSTTDLAVEFMLSRLGIVTR